MATNNAWNSPSLTTNGQILIGSTGASPSAAVITGDSDIAITNGAASITVDNNAAGGGDLVKISTATASSSASIEFTDLTSTYFLYIVRWNNLAPQNDATTLTLETSTDNGATYDTAGSDYGWRTCIVYETGGQNTSGNSTDGSITLMGPAATGDEMGSGANELGSGVLYLYNPSAVKYTFMNYRGHYFNETGDTCSALGGAVRSSAADVDAIRFIMDVANISSGTFVLYGVSNA